jgi:hypothetical protein
LTAATTLDASLLDRLVAALRAQGAPIVDYLNAGIADAELDALTAPLGIKLPAEARVWWRYADGVPRHAPLSSVGLSASWWWAPLEEIVHECREMREIVSEDVQPGEPGLFKDSWLPIVIGDAILAIDTSQPVIAPVYTIDFADLEPSGSYTPILPSLGSLVQTWTLALENGAVRYDHDQQLFNVDGDRLDALGIEITLI